MKRGLSVGFLAAAGAAVIVAFLVTTSRPVAAPSPTPPASATPSPTPPVAATTSSPGAATPPVGSPPCRNDYLAGETPLVAPRKSGRSAEVALDAVKVGPGPFGATTRWLVRAFNPTGSGGTFELPLRARVLDTPGREIPIVGYEAGPPNSEAGRVTETVAIDPCDPTATPGTRQRGRVVLVVHTAPITSGTYTLTLRDIKLPEGVTRDETWTVALTCTISPGPAGALECRRQAS